MAPPVERVSGPTRIYSVAVDQPKKETHRFRRTDSYIPSPDPRIKKLVGDHPIRIAQAPQEKKLTPEDLKPKPRDVSPQSLPFTLSPEKTGKKGKKSTIPMPILQWGEGRVDLIYPVEVPPSQAVPWSVPLITVGQKPKGRTPTEGTPRTLSLEALLKKARAHLQRGEFEECRRIVSEVLQERPLQASALSLVALSFIGEGKAGEAKPILDKLARIAPDEWDYLQPRSYFELRFGKPEAALPHLRRWHELYGDNFEVLQTLVVTLGATGDKPSGLKILQSFKPQTPQDEASTGILRVMWGDVEGGTKMLRVAAKKAPNNPHILGNLSFALREQHNPEGEMFADCALKLKPGQYPANFVKAAYLWNRHVDHSKKGNLKELPLLIKEMIPLLEGVRDRILREKERALSGPLTLLMTPLDDSDLQNWFKVPEDDATVMLGMAYFHTENFSAAEGLLEKTWESSKKSDRPLQGMYHTLMIAETKKALHKIDEAEKYFREGIEGWSDNPRLLARYIRFLADQNRFDALEPHLKKLRELAQSSNDLYSYLTLGMVAVFERRFDEAEKFLTRAAELGPNLADIHAALAFMYRMKKDVSSASKAAERAVQLGSLDPSPYQILISISLRKKQWMEVDRYIEAMVQSVPDGASAALKIASELHDWVVYSIGKTGLASLTFDSDEKQWISIATKWFEYAATRVASNSLLVSSARFLNGSSRPGDVEALERFYTPDAAHFYGLVRAGAIEVAKDYFAMIWNHPKVKRELTIAIAEVILKNTYPPEASPLVALMAAKMGDHTYVNNQLKRASSYYRKAIELDPSLEEGWIGLTRTYRARGMKAKAREIEIRRSKSR